MSVWGLAVNGQLHEKGQVSGLETWDLSYMRNLFKETSDSVRYIFKIAFSYHVED